MKRVMATTCSVLPENARVVWYVCRVFRGLVGDVWCGMCALYSVAL